MSKVTTVGIDLTKNTFVLFGLGPKGHSGWKRKVRRKQLLEQLVRLEPCTVALGGVWESHYWARQIRALGHQVELLPPQHVKGYLRGQKTITTMLRPLRRPVNMGEFARCRSKRSSSRMIRCCTSCARA